MIGSKSAYIESQILQLPLSPSLKKRVSELREGSELRLHGFARDCYWYLKRLTKEEINHIQKGRSLRANLWGVEEEIRELSPYLHDEKVRIQKELRKWKKKSNGLE